VILSSSDFKSLIQNAPLFSIDLVLIDDQHQILLGLRKNPPAKGSWFVPGGRVYKNETLAQAFARISKSELGQEFKINEAVLLGLYDHFYADSAYGKDLSTHYINASYLLRIRGKLRLPNDQHSDYRWLHCDALDADVEVHPNSRLFLQSLKKELTT
jgi:colanic acid biosynthesis protein WcaH